MGRRSGEPRGVNKRAGERSAGMTIAARVDTRALNSAAKRQIYTLHWFLRFIFTAQLKTKVFSRDRCADSTLINMHFKRQVTSCPKIVTRI